MLGRIPGAFAADGRCLALVKSNRAVTMIESTTGHPPTEPILQGAATFLSCSGEGATQPMQETDYVIRGGVQGRERLRLLARVLRPTTLGLFAHVGIRPGMTCLDVGCGGGDVAFDLARATGAGGKVVGIDIDRTKL